ncbi:hypothetical protein QQM39_17505 [Streptomyces sp. DT2A-34]|uniref:hypothetical protein n=1 Tax=Streptomyces sp. DT2A-34 TaxID=3051182 RepID=UPI00265B8174|nr:hypothetical protein [Streptomyces sp. DT2A-34]MDO0912582.1 hypothetical protein [Streptomyces sp. DT2A-34]
MKGHALLNALKAEPNSFYAFAQRDLSAVLGGRVARSFVAPNSGTHNGVFLGQPLRVGGGAVPLRHTAGVPGVGSEG